MAIIEFNYNQAISQAKQIDDIATEMLGVANNHLQTTVDSIGTCWRGDASQQFLRYCTATQGDVRTQANKLKELADRIRKVAQVIKETEERAKAAAAAAAAVNKISSGEGTGGGFSSSAGNLGGGGGRQAF